MPLAFAMFVYCLSVCVCVCTPFPPEALRQPNRFRAYSHVYMCTYVCVYVCVAYLPLAALFISLFMTILVFMVSLPQLSDCRFYIYVVGWPARALQPHMVSLPYVCVCVCMCMHVYACLWNFLCLDLLLYGLLMLPLYSTEFVSVYCVSFVCRCVYFFCVLFFLHIIFYQTFVVVIKFWLLSNCLYWLEDFTWVLNKVLFLNELVFRNRKLITMSAVTLGWQIVIGQVLPKVSGVNDWKTK